MDLDLLAIAVLLTLAGLYLLESELSAAPIQDMSDRNLRPARNALEQAWVVEPIQVFMRQLLAARQRRAGGWHVSGRN